MATSFILTNFRIKGLFKGTVTSILGITKRPIRGNGVDVDVVFFYILISFSSKGIANFPRLNYDLKGDVFKVSIIKTGLFPQTLNVCVFMKKKKISHYVSSFMSVVSIYFSTVQDEEGEGISSGCLHIFVPGFIINFSSASNKAMTVRRVLGDENGICGIVVNFIVRDEAFISR